MFNLSNAVAVFLLCLYLPTVSSTSSVGESSVSNLLNLLLKSAHALLVGNRHTGECVASCSSWYSTDVVLMTLLFKLLCARHILDELPARFDRSACLSSAAR